MDILSFTLNNRLFKVGDRVKIYHEEKWWAGIVEKFMPWRWTYPRPFFKTLKDLGCPVVLVSEDGWKTTYDDYGHAYMYVRTDEKVGEDTDLFEGFGIRSAPNGLHIIFENEPEYEVKPAFLKFIESSDNSIEDLPF